LKSRPKFNTNKIAFSIRRFGSRNFAGGHQGVTPKLTTPKTDSEYTACNQLWQCWRLFSWNSCNENFNFGGCHNWTCKTL